MTTDRPYEFALQFYVPLAMAGIFVYLCMTAKGISGCFPILPAKLVDAYLPAKLFGDVALPPITVPRIVGIRAIYLAAASVAVWRSARVDLASYLPSHLKLRVYFSVDAIRETLQLFSPLEQERARIATDWVSHLVEYDTAVRERLQALWLRLHVELWPEGVEDLRGWLAGEGEAGFRGERHSLLNYRLAAAKGKVKFTLEAERRPTKRFQSEFYLRDTAANRIALSWRDLWRGRGIVIIPEFKQVFFNDEGRDDAIFDHTLVAMTRIRPFPLPSLSDTLYLWQRDDGSRIPIGVAVYE
ncbi:MAG: hypothetical protein KGN76_01905 [Acidobacteriota bacterium]|nr:hypothetical protein [Acidobacteriota bacterium]